LAYKNSESKESENKENYDDYEEHQDQQQSQVDGLRTSTPNPNKLSASKSILK
jgi:hypothetical protein